MFHVSKKKKKKKKIGNKHLLNLNSLDIIWSSF